MSESILTWAKYKHLPTPEPAELIGEWRIRMDAWWGRLFVNKKVIEKVANNISGILFGIVGHNIAYGFIQWGKFYVTGNGELYYHNRKIVDWLVRESKDKMRGLYIYNGKPKYTFTMERIDAVQGEEREGG